MLEVVTEHLQRLLFYIAEVFVTMFSLSKNSGVASAWSNPEALCAENGVHPHQLGVSTPIGCGARLILCHSCFLLMAVS